MGKELETCRCGAPCHKEVLPRGGDYGWGDDASRTVLRYVAPTPGVPVERVRVTRDDAVMLVGQAAFEGMDGRTEMRAHLLTIARRIAETIADEDIVERIDALAQEGTSNG